MSKLTIIFLIALFSFSFCKLRKNNTQCSVLGRLCHLFKWCCSDLVCKDYRCSKPGTKDNRLKWAPEGAKCDWFHSCKDGYQCRNNRCVKVTIQKVEKATSS